MKAKTVRALTNEVVTAYSDCCNGGQFENRNLDYRASVAVPRDVAFSIMSKACPSGYNDFEADWLLLLPVDCLVTLAREGSVCIYVTPPLKEEIRAMQASEWSLDPEANELRIYWD